MAQSQTVTKQGMFADNRRDFIEETDFSSGMDTLLFPNKIMQGCYVSSTNTLNRGGIVQTRPRRRRISSFIGTYAQGMQGYRTFDQTQYVVVAIDGLLYYSQFPFNTFTQIPGIAFSKNAPRIYMCKARQGVQIVAGNIVVLTNPIDWLIFQDGVNAPAWWVAPNSTPSGFNSSNQPQPTPTTLPIGTVMAFSGNRLWLAKGNSVLASDFLNPQSFVENTYVAEKSAFYFPKPVSNLKQAPQDSGLFVTTEEGLYSLQSNILDRTQWQTTPLFQATITEQFGNPAPFAFIYQHGLPWFWSAKGFISMDMALNTNITAIVYPKDGEMIRSKARISPLQANICAGFFDNVLLLSVPSSSNFNRHTWVMDGGVANKLASSQGICWSSIWTGTFPVQYDTILVSGVEHCLELSYSGGYLTNGPNQGIHLWENFLSSITNDDNSTPVQCSMETRMYMMPNDELHSSQFIEVQLANVSGLVTLQFFIAGIAGLYELVSTTVLRADIGPFFNLSGMPTIYYKFTGQPDTKIESYRPQTRYPRSQEIPIQSLVSPSDPHVIELGTLPWIDKGFQILLVWTGNMGVRAIKCFYLAKSEKAIGELATNESQTPHIVLESG